VAVTKESSHSYAETVAILSKTILDAGNRVFATIDQAAAAAEVGLSLRPTTLIIFGNPKGGTGLMDAFPLVALDLPLKLVVWSDADRVKVSYVPMSEIAARYGVKGVDAQIAAMDHALDALTSRIV
jgi:uncharacterized protein (DUF302 family)